MKKIIAAALILCTLCSMAVPAFAAADEKTTEEATQMNLYRYGLHVEEDGTITLEGKPFYAFGLNYFGAFTHYVDGTTPDPQTFIDGLAGVAEHNIPFVRFPLCGYYPNYYDMFDEDPEAILNMMQEVLDEAQKNKIGVIVSLLWWDAALPEHVGEKRSDMGRADSKTLEYAKYYVSTIVKRFADHPAVWGWEIGNEYNLTADLCDKNFKDYLWADGLPGFSDTEKNGFDYFTSEEMVFYFTELANVIRQYDKYRMITTGNSEMRPSAWSMHQATRRINTKDHTWNIDWSADSYNQFIKAVTYYTPDPIDTISFHLQFGTAGSSEPSYLFTVDRFGNSELSCLEYFKAYADAAKQSGKALYFGEFGDFLDMESAEDCPEKFRQVAEWVHEAGIQIASLWQFQDYTDSGTAAKKLDVLSELNLELVADGSQDVSAAWEPHEKKEPITDAGEETSDGEESVNTESGSSNQEESSDNGADTKGCKSSVGISAAAGVSSAVLSSAVAFKRKKRKNQ